ncbi:hypothetical protein C8J57DRAFT_17993 [Mycena rebaudengoi]|nr:hypothetical protein C8J57DRAFT_17993 [Mycena rebaudengoi]
MDETFDSRMIWRPCSMLIYIGLVDVWFFCRGRTNTKSDGETTEKVRFPNRIDCHGQRKKSLAFHYSTTTVMSEQPFPSFSLVLTIRTPSTYLVFPWTTIIRPQNPTSVGPAPVANTVNNPVSVVSFSGRAIMAGLPHIRTSSLLQCILPTRASLSQRSASFFMLIAKLQALFVAS